MQLLATPLSLAPSSRAPDLSTRGGSLRRVEPAELPWLKQSHWRFEGCLVNAKEGVTDFMVRIRPPCADEAALGHVVPGLITIKTRGTMLLSP